jgi:hypothetical protein
MQLTVTGKKTALHAKILTTTKKQIENLASQYGVHQTTILNTLLVKGLEGFKMKKATKKVAKKVVKKISKKK